MLCEIRQFRDVEKKCKETKEPRSWKSIVPQQARLNLKWFYLPPDAGINFAERSRFHGRSRRPRPMGTLPGRLALSGSVNLWEAGS